LRQPGIEVGIALRELDERAAHAGVPAALIEAALKLKSSDGRIGWYARRVNVRFERCVRG